MNPKVSVVIANFNSEKYISAAIESILSQTFEDFELIIVDDKSSDDSISIIKRFCQKDHRIILIEQSENLGVTPTRQNGIMQARGMYVAILDSDDISLPNRLEEQVSILDGFADVVLVSSHYGVIDQNGILKRKQKKVHENQAAIKWFMTFGNCFAHSTIMFRLQTAIELGGYDQNIKRGLDMELSSKLLTKGKAYTIPKTLVYWRTYSKSMTKSVDKIELEKNYISSVQNSINLHLNFQVDFNTARAVFYNYKKPAIDILSFQNALNLVVTAFKNYTNEFKDSDKKHLQKSALRHMLKIYERNKKESWWNEGEKLWVITYNEIFKTSNALNLIFSNYSSLSTRNILNLLKAAIKKPN